MKYSQQVLDEPGGNPVPFLGIRVKRKSDGVTLTSLVTDANGFVTYEASGHSEPFYFETTNTVGGPRFWLSDETMPAGGFSPAELPHLLRALGDGVLPNDGGFGLTIVGTTLTLGSGVSLAAGYPVVIYDDVTINATRPSSGTRIDRIVSRVYPAGASTDPGYADVALVAGTVDSGSAPALVQTANEWQVKLWRVVVPAAGALTAIDDRVPMLNNYGARFPEVTAHATTGAFSVVETSSAGGEALAALTTSLVLPETATYTVDAEVTAVQDVAATGGYAYSAQVGTAGSGDGQFSVPVSIAILNTGDFWVTDLGNDRLQRFTTALVYSAQAGGSGAGDGQFTAPWGIAVDSSDNLFVTDAEAHRVQRFTSAGVYAAKFGSLGAGDGQFNTPKGVAITLSSGRIYVADQNNNRIQYFTSAGTFAGKWGSGGSAPGNLSSPADVCINQTTGNVFVVDAGNDRVQEFTATGAFVRTFGSSGSGPGQFLSPATIDIHPLTGNLYVTDALRDDIQELTPLGVFVRSIATAGSGNGEVSNPGGMAVSSTGSSLFIVDSSNNRVQQFAANTAGYGSVALRIDGNLGDYLGVGNMSGTVANVHIRDVAGPATITIEAYGKATAGTMTLKSAALSVAATAKE